ncbi:hypothetical protein Z517_11211 [Fonsecaea pedrosoi CBS 271.37]|uniref:Unplaced genomic scaffold supercont1.7, whole genome shotgun sequence n=1 Tax=Fonsecaea pedrosoi CBS 271.37 TaxID=1442368 RepID=A0A0D2GCP1_9EURO|nr:uncharacterized protein Z517_11211 [Fonsecaea pedrosoi CBS 271.37]KIW76465.1 hypothetical protein Z517_11211 [Fonsecaea pedrosoi CBS 271.37]
MVSPPQHPPTQQYSRRSGGGTNTLQFQDVTSGCKCHCGKSIPWKWAARCSRTRQCPDYYSLHCHKDDCNLKECRFHGHCWDGHLPKSSKLAASHVPVGMTVQHLLVRDIIHSEDQTETLRQLHEQNAATRWFNIRHRNSQPVLYVYDRFGPLCEPMGADPTTSSTAATFPTFVSFIGKSGVGKSTLVRAMLLLGNLNIQQVQDDDIYNLSTNQSRVDTIVAAISSQQEMPVTRSGHVDHAADPTTLGVHLYKDEKGSSSNSGSSTDATDGFTLFADCEGFFAGPAQTNAERFTADQGNRARTATPTTTNNNNHSIANEDATEANVLYKAPVTAASYARHGQQGAELFYARFLYAVSDVVVFVTNEDQNITLLLVNALEWAATAVMHSVNYPSRKTLIIVRNGALGHSRQFVDNELLERLYLDRQAFLWKSSSILQDFVDDYNSRQDGFSKHIYRNRDLYDALYDKIVCCCIPHVNDIDERGDETMFSQYLKLRTQIDEASQRAISMRSKGWMKYNVSSLSQILFSAFEHFRTNDGAFNFNEVARISKPNPQSFSDHVANFMRLALESSPSGTARTMIPDIIGLSFVVWAMRSLIHVVDPAHLFDRFSDSEKEEFSLAQHCHSALQEYQEKYQQCGYKFSENDFCTNGPDTAHQRLHLSTSKKRADGGFTPRHHLDTNLVSAIRARFLVHYESVVSDDGTGHRSMTKPASGKIRRVRQAVMQKYNGQWTRMTSNITCLACLQAVPENVLHCGHGYCVQCVRELGRPSESFESAWTFEVCPLCSARMGDNYSHLIRERPRCAGVRILTLDGGGIRGIIELAIIQEMEKRLGLPIPFRDYFDLVVGTSTGGIIALALTMGDRDANTQTSLMTEAFKSFASSTFAHPRAGSLLTKIGLGHFVTSVVMSFGLYQALFDSTPLETGLKKFFGTQTSLFGSARTRHHQCSTRVAVVATKEFGKRAHLITSYNRPNLGPGSDFEREDDESKGMRIWEAGLATAAAPFYLAPFKKAETGILYFDGALHMNCPAPGAVEEIRKLWPEPHSPSLDVLVSVGTGIQESEVKIPRAIRIGGFEEICRTFHSKLDSENQWQEFTASGATDGIRDRLHRLNPPIDEHLQKVTLWQWNKMAKLEDMVQRQMREPEWRARLDNAANTLRASLFYFEPDGEATSSSSSSTNNLTPTGTRHVNNNHNNNNNHINPEIQGTIRSRLRHGSAELARLLTRVTGFFYTTLSMSRGSPWSLLQHDPWTEITAFAAVKDAVIQSGQRFRVPVRLDEPSETKLLVLAVRLHDCSAPLPISGFPTLLHELHLKARSWD